MPCQISSITNVKAVEPVTLENIIFRIQFDPTIAQTISEMKEIGDKKERDDFKTFNLPAFSLHEFKGALYSANFKSTKYLMYDVDDISTQRINIVKDDLKGIACFFMRSPSGTGIKFAILLEKEITDTDTYRLNFRHYKEYFSNLLQLELCKSYHGWHTFYSSDEEAYYDEDVTPFPVMDANIESKTEDVDITSVDNGEIADICHFLQGFKLSFGEWTTAAMSLQGVQSGEQLFMMLSQNNFYQDTPETITKKYYACKSSKVTIASLYYMAFQRGYERKEHFMRDGKGRLYPFEVRKDGSYFQDKGDASPKQVFSFKRVKYLYTIETIASENQEVIYIAVFEFDKKRVEIPLKQFNVNDIRRIIMGKGNIGYTTTNNYKVYEMLFRYLGKINTNRMVTDMLGIGKLKDGLWNFGNMISLNGKVIPFERIVWEDDDRGYILSERKDVEIRDCKDPKAKFNLIHQFYDSWSSIAIGWATANIFYDYIMEDFGCFPNLYIEGKTESGKSILGDLILSLFGVSDNKHFKLEMERTTTPTAVYRVKHDCHSIPTMFDEYDDRFFGELRAMFNGTGRARALKDHTNKIDKSEINSGSIFTSQYKSLQPEAVNRCVYIDMANVKKKKDSHVFDRELIKKKHELSSFGIYFATKYTYEKFLEKFDEAYDLFGKFCTDVDSRIITNYSFAYAGYLIVRESGLITDWSDSGWWVDRVNETWKNISGTSQVDIIMNHLIRMAGDGTGEPFIWFAEPREPIMVNGLRCMIVQFSIMQAMARIKDYDNRREHIVTMSVDDFKSEIESEGFQWLIPSKVPYPKEYRKRKYNGEVIPLTIYELAIPMR